MTQKQLSSLTETEKEVLSNLQSGKTLQLSLAPMIKRVVEAALEAEISEHMANESEALNRRNGKTRKLVKTTSGEFELKTPRDRLGSFEPQMVKKRQTNISGDIESKIISLFAAGMSYSDIRQNI